MRPRRSCDRRKMPRYLVEAYVADSPSAYADVCEQAGRAAALGGVRHVRTTFLPSDEVALHVFEAPSAAALRRAGSIAALQYERIVEAIEESLPLPGGGQE